MRGGSSRPGPPEGGPHVRGDVVVLRYITTDGRIDFAWPCRVVEDGNDLVALFISAGSVCKADPKLTAAQKLAADRKAYPTHDVVWRSDTLRLMFPGASHSVWLFWTGTSAERRFERYFVNLEAPFVRTAIGFETQDHTVDIVVTPELDCSWRDEQDFDDHVALGLYSPELAAAARAEGHRVIEAITGRTHRCLDGWAQWSPDPRWGPLSLPATWNRLTAAG